MLTNHQYFSVFKHRARNYFCDLKLDAQTCLIFSSPSKTNFCRWSTSKLYSCLSSLSSSGASWLSLIICRTVSRNSCISRRNFRLISANFLASSRWLWERRRLQCKLNRHRKKPTVLTFIETCFSCIRQWRIQGRGPGGPGSTLTFSPLCAEQKVGWFLTPKRGQN